MTGATAGVPERLVVVGAGLGGLRVVEQLRAHGYGGRITMAGGEIHPPYDRPPLTKQVLRGERDSSYLRDDYAPLDAEMVLGQRVERLDTERRHAILADGRQIAFDVAVLAPGAVPRRLPGIMTRPGLHVVRTLEDSLAVRDGMTATGDVTIIGGGFIGCEIAASATSVGARATVLEALDAPLIRQVGAVAAAEIEALHRRHGVDVITGVSVASVDGAEHVEEVVLSGGRRLPARNVVLGLGVVPDVAWLAGTPIAVDDGIVCTAGGRTTVPGIYAVGDAARWWHPLARDWRRVEHWTTAADQAAVVAANIAAGAPPDHDPHTLSEVPYFWSDQYDVKVQALGFLDPMADTDLIRPSGRTVVIYSQAGILTGVLGISAARSVMRLRTLIAARATRKEAVALLTSS